MPDQTKPDQELEVNDPKYYMSEPKRQVGCSVPTKAQFDAILEGLSARGISTENLKVLHGRDGADILDMSGEHHSFFAGVRRIFPTINNAIMLNMSEVEKVLNADGYALAVPAKDYEAARVVATTLLDHGATNVLYFGKNKMWQFS